MNLIANTYASEKLDRITTFILVNILWMVLAALLITLPLAMAGLFAVLVPWVQGQPVEPMQAFFGAMRRYALKSIAIVLADVIIAGCAAINFQLFSQMDMTQLPALISLNITVFVAVLAVLTNVYLWVLLVTVDQPLGRLVKLALRLVMLNPLWSIFITLLAGIPLLLSLVLPGLFVLLGTYAACAAVIVWGAGQIIEKYPVNDRSTGALNDGNAVSVAPGSGATLYNG